MKLTPEQIANWRNVLIQTLGCYALIMPDKEIIMYANKLQEAANEN